MTVLMNASGHGRSSPGTAAGTHNASISVTSPAAADALCVIGISMPTAPRTPPRSRASAVSAAKMVGGVPVFTSSAMIRAPCAIRQTPSVRRRRRSPAPGAPAGNPERVPDGDDNLESALARDAEHFKGERQIDVRLAVKGDPRPLRPLARDAVYQISREALANTFRHARAKHVEVDVEYSRDELTVRVRDDGRGMAPNIVDAGRPGHFGLPGMRERAEQMGAVLRLWSRVGAGTEVEIHVPAKTAFPDASPRRGVRWWWRAREPRDS